MSVPSDLVQNERTKLLANALDRASTAALVVGVFGPLAGYLYGTQTASSDVGVALGSITWLIGAVMLHYFARRALRSLK